jgi:folate-dependent phosphoribosylglycinamide formyltransferase PurN
VQRHFQSLQKSEAQWFPDALSMEQLENAQLVHDVNDIALVQQAKRSGADVVILNGTAILKPVWLEAFPERVVNLHLGLAPFYKGSATLFWPFADQKLGLLGATIHLAVERVDSGRILRRVLPDWIEGEDYYAITNRLIRKSMDVLPSTVKAYLEGKVIPVPQENIAGRLCRKADFSEEALTRALMYVANGITSEQIERARRETPCLSC